jgi:hypothetical protein
LELLYVGSCGFGTPKIKVVYEPEEQLAHFLGVRPLVAPAFSVLELTEQLGGRGVGGDTKTWGGVFKGVKKK